MNAVLVLAGLVLIVAAGFVVSLPLGLALAGVALIFTAWSSRVAGR